jgi:hypothetical protein
MATTAKIIIRKAMQKAGILTKAQQPAADEANDALDAMNAMLSSWSNDSLMIYTRSWESFPLVGGQIEYTIGPGQTFNTVRPIDIVDAYIRTSGISDDDMMIVNDEIYTSQIRLKTAPGRPEWLNFDNNYPDAIIRLWPVPPSAVYSIFLLSEKILPQFNLNDTVDLAPGWERMIIYNLALEIASDYGVEVPQDVRDIATKSKVLVNKAIIKNRSLDAYPRQAEPNNIFSGWNR